MIEKIKFGSHEEWLSIRNRYIGGSDAGAVVGMNPYKSAYTLWAEKTGKLPAFEGNITTRVGAYLEDLVAHMFQEETGKRVQKNNSTLVNSKFPFACANLDRIVCGEKALLEIKTTNSLPNMKQIRGGEFPDTWYCQMTHYLAVSELEKAYLAVLVNCREFHVFELERDEDEIASLMRAEADFWEKVKNNTPPAVDGHESTGKTIAAMYPESGEGEVSLMAYEKDLSRYCELGERIKELKTAQDECANHIKEYMQECPKGYSDGYKVSYATAVRKSFDSKKLLEDNPGVDFMPYFKTTNTRTFRVTKTKRG